MRKKSSATTQAAPRNAGATRLAAATKAGIRTYDGMAETIESCADAIAQGLVEVNQANAILNACGKMMRLADMHYRREQAGAAKAKMTKLIPA